MPSGREGEGDGSQRCVVQSRTRELENGAWIEGAEIPADWQSRIGELEGGGTRM